MLRVLTVAALAVGVTAMLQADEKPAFDATKLVGTWKLAEGMKAGEKADVANQKEGGVFTKDTITLKNEMGTFEFKYTVDAKASPIAIDMEITKPEGFKGAKSKGILKLDGDKLVLCYNPDAEGKRPEKFESTGDNKFFLWTMKKEAK